MATEKHKVHALLRRLETHKLFTHFTYKNHLNLHNIFTMLFFTFASHSEGWDWVNNQHFRNMQAALAWIIERIEMRAENLNFSRIAAISSSITQSPRWCDAQSMWNTWIMNVFVGWEMLQLEFMTPSNTQNQWLSIFRLTSSASSKRRRKTSSTEIYNHKRW